MNIIVFITTFNRSEELKSTLKSLCSDEDFLARNKVKFEVYDDKSDNEHAIKNIETCQEFGAKYCTTAKNHGKENFWRIHNKIIKSLSDKRFDYVFSLQDDYLYDVNFFSKAVKIFRAIKKQDKKIICLNLQDNRIGQKYWNTNLGATELLSISGIEAYKVAWIDCVFCANRKFFEILDFKVAPVHKSRWKRNKNKSSGVGQNMSDKIANSSYNVYQLKNPLVRHIGLVSRMNYYRK